MCTTRTACYTQVVEPLFDDGYLKGATRDRRASTKRNYEDAFRPVRERLGARPLQSITKADVEELMDWMLTNGKPADTRKQALALTHKVHS